MSEKFAINIATTAGHPVQVAIGWFWQEVVPDGVNNPRPSIQIHAIHVLTSEDDFTPHMKLRHEFRAKFDYSMAAVDSIKEWLSIVETDRRQGDYETVEEFLEEFANFMAEPGLFQSPKKPIKRHETRHNSNE